MSSTPMDKRVAAESWWRQVDRWFDAVSDRMNPILVKETRQAFKSRQFVVTFLLVLGLSWTWSMFGVAIQSPGIYYAPGGPFLLVGFFMILTFPLAVIVPFTAFRSLASEREDGTYELLSISALRPSQIIMGKLGIATLQILLYLSAVSPCVVFTYLLRGVDILSILMFLSYAFLVSLLLSAVGLLLGALTRPRQWQTVLSVVFVVALAGGCFASCMLISAWLMEAGLMPLRLKEFWIAQGALFCFWLAVFGMTLLAATARIAPRGENRSTPLRLGMMACHAALLAWVVWYWQYEQHVAVLAAYVLPATAFWTLMGFMMVGESSHLSPRMRRGLPRTLTGRVFLGVLYPGRGTGYLFAVAQMSAMAVVATALSFLSLEGRNSLLERLLMAAGMCVAYVTLYLGVASLLLRGLQKARRPTGPVVGLFVGGALVLFGILIPLIVQFSLARVINDADDYTILQAPNVFWTVFAILDGDLQGGGWEILVPPLVSVLAVGVFFLNVLASARELVAPRSLTPRRVIRDDGEGPPDAAVAT